jgi:hypothetical protein
MNTYILPVVYEGEMMDDVIWDSIYIASTPAFLTSIVFFVAVSLLTQKNDPPKPLADVNGKLVDMHRPFGFGDLHD